MDVGRSVSYPFRGSVWLPRILVGALLEVVPLLAALPLLRMVLRSSHHLRPGGLVWLPFAALVGLACRLCVIGYMRRIVIDVLAGADRELPPWDRFGEDFVEGLKLWLVMLALWLPGLGLVLAAMFLVGMAAWSGAAWLPAVIFGPPVALVTLFYLPAGLLNAIATGDIGRAFDIPRVTARIGRTFGPYLLAFLFAVATEIFAQTGLILFCVGIFATRFVAHAMTVHVFASVFARDERMPATPQGPVPYVPFTPGATNLP
jgi:hypothetical protein